jgi:hypothetical protein
MSYAGEIHNKLRHGLTSFYGKSIFIIFYKGQGDYIFPNPYFKYSGSWEAGVMNGLEFCVSADY